jgi:hypothetical protein
VKIGEYGKGPGSVMTWEAHVSTAGGLRTPLTYFGEKDPNRTKMPTHLYEL